MFWIILAVVFSILVVFVFLKTNKIINIITISGTIGVIISVVCFIFIPIKGYMKVDKTHWYWTINIYTYEAVAKSGETNYRSYSKDAKNDAEKQIPKDAYNVNIIVDAKTVKNSDNISETRYIARFTYTIDEWIKTSEVQACGNDKNPYEPERPYGTESDSVIGNKKCQFGHDEIYTVSGYVEDEYLTFDISKDAWLSITDNDEFTYRKFRFGKNLISISIAQ